MHLRDFPEFKIVSRNTHSPRISPNALIATKKQPSQATSCPSRFRPWYNSRSSCTNGIGYWRDTTPVFRPWRARQGLQLSSNATSNEEMQIFGSKKIKHAFNNHILCPQNSQCSLEFRGECNPSFHGQDPFCFQPGAQTILEGAQNDF